MPAKREAAAEAKPTKKSSNRLPNLPHFMPPAEILSGIVVAGLGAWAWFRMRHNRYREAVRAARSAASARRSTPAITTKYRRQGLKNKEDLQGSNRFWVFKADCAELQTKIVCKSATDPKDRAILDRENDVLECFKGDDQINQVIEYDNGARDPGIGDDLPHLYLEYLDGFDLQTVRADWNETSHPRTTDELTRFAKQIAEAMVVVHDKDIVHRDLKPENIMVSRDYKKITIIDFGSATKITDEAEMCKYAGTAAYVAPEVGIKRLDWHTRNEVYDRKVDVFSYGTILFELMTGENAFNDLGRDELRILNAVCKREKRGAVEHIFVRPFGVLNKIMLDCWNEDPVRRPTFKDIVKRLSGA